MGQSFGEAMKDKIEGLKGCTPEEELKIIVWLEWCADQIEDELNDWYKRYEMADDTLTRIRERLNKINIWEDQGRQMQNCVQDVHQELGAYAKKYETYSSGRTEHYINRKEPEV